MMKKDKKESCFFIGLSLCLFVFFMFINFSFPFTSDDLFFFYHLKIDSVKDAIMQAIYFHNGRILGNTLIILLVRNTLFRVLVKSTVMYLIFFMLTKLLHIKNKTLLLVAAILIIFPSVSMYAQVYAWSAGFANYLPPVMLFLFTLLLFRESHKHPFIYGVIMSLTGIVMQLFCEHTTLFFCIVSFSVLVYAWFVKKNKRVLSLFYFFSTAVGALLMFGIPMALGKEINQGGYRGIGGNWSENALIFVNVMLDCFLVWIFISLGALLQLNQKKEFCIRGYNIKNAIKGVLIFFPIYSVFQFLLSKGWVSPKGYEMQWFLLLFFILYLFCVALVFVQDWKLFYCSKICIVLFYTIVSALPLLFVFPVRARVFHLPYIGFCVIAILSFQQTHTVEYSNVQSKLHSALISLTAVLMILFSLVAIDWNYASSMREIYFARMMELKRKEILMPELPHSELLQADGDNSFWQFRVKSMTDQEVVLIFTDWETWLREKEPPAE